MEAMEWRQVENGSWWKTSKNHPSLLWILFLITWSIQASFLNNSCSEKWYTNDIKIQGQNLKVAEVQKRINLLLDSAIAGGKSALTHKVLQCHRHVLFHTTGKSKHTYVFQCILFPMIPWNVWTCLDRKDVSWHGQFHTAPTKPPWLSLGKEIEGTRSRTLAPSMRRKAQAAFRHLFVLWPTFKHETSVPVFGVGQMTWRNVKEWSFSFF